MKRVLRVVAIVVAACGGSEHEQAAHPSAVVESAPNAKAQAAPSPAPSSEPTPAPLSDAGPIANECGTFPPAGDLAKNGAFGFTVAGVGPSCTLISPQKLGDGGVRHPVIVWGNGTSAPVTLYQAALELWASHGFVVIAANALDGQGSGTPQLACLDWLQGEAEKPSNPFYGKLCPRVAATGHSQGGGGALMVGRDPRIVATAPLQPYTAQGFGGFDRASFDAQRGPMLLLSGTLDNNAVPPIHQQPVFDATNVPVFWGKLVGGDHYSVALGVGGYRAQMLAWFRLQLLGDETQRPVFYGASCSLCTDSHWQVERRGID